MRKVLIGFFLLFSCCLAYAETESNGYYLSLNAGASGWFRTSNNDEIESSAAPGRFLQLSIGYQLNDLWSFELSGIHRRNDLHGINPSYHDVNLSADGNRIYGNSVHGNVVFTPVSEFIMSPYVFVGIGFTNLDIQYDFFDSGRKIEDSETVVSGQIGTGFLLNISNNVYVDIGYQYMRTSTRNVEWDGDSELNVMGGELQLVYDNHVFFSGLHINL